MSKTIKIYIEARSEDEATVSLERLFDVHLYSLPSDDEYEERKPMVRQCYNIFEVELPLSDDTLRTAQEELAKERIFNFTRGEE